MNNTITARPIGVPFAFATLLALTPTNAFAQQPPREGFWWGLGLGYGLVNVGCDICDGGRGMAFSGAARLGGTISRTLLLGAEGNGWTRSQEEIDEYLGSLSAIVHWYPDPLGALYLKGGFGYVAYRIDDAENALTSNGFGPQVGAGYEFQVGRNFWITPAFNAIVTLPAGNLYFNGDRQASGVSLALLQLSLGLTRH